MPPAVALLNYISSGILWQIFCQTGIFAGFSLRMYHLITGRINAAAMAWDIIFFSLAGPVGDYTGAPTVIFRLQGCDGWGEDIIFHSIGRREIIVQYTYCRIPKCMPHRRN